MDYYMVLLTSLLGAGIFRLYLGNKKVECVLRETTTEIKDALFELNKKTDRLQRGIDNLLGFQHRFDRTTEEECIATLTDLLTQEGYELERLPNRYFGEDKEVDGIILFRRLNAQQGGLALLEAKHRVTHSAVSQLARKIGFAVEDKRRIEVEKRVQLTELRAYLGGPLHNDGIKREAWRRNFGVLELSGSRYKLTPAPRFRSL